MAQIKAAWSYVIAHPGKVAGIVGACVLAVLQTLAGKGILPADFPQAVQNVAAIVFVLVAGYLPANWRPE